MNFSTHPEKTLPSTFDNMSFTDDMDLDLLRELIADGILPESYDPAYVTQEDMEAFHADMRAMPIDLPTDAEILAMAEARGIPSLPF
jgi:hypothetical protein